MVNLKIKGRLKEKVLHLKCKQLRILSAFLLFYYHCALMLSFLLCLFFIIGSPRRLLLFVLRWIEASVYVHPYVDKSCFILFKYVLHLRFDSQFLFWWPFVFLFVVLDFSEKEI